MPTCHIETGCQPVTCSQPANLSHAVSLPTCHMQSDCQTANLSDAVRLPTCCHMQPDCQPVTCSQTADLSHADCQSVNLSHAVSLPTCCHMQPDCQPVTRSQDCQLFTCLTFKTAYKQVGKVYSFFSISPPCPNLTHTRMEIDLLLSSHQNSQFNYCFENSS